MTKAQGDVTQGSIYVRLQELEDRKKVAGRKWDQFQIMARARKVMARYPDLRSSVQIPQAISSGTGPPCSLQRLRMRRASLPAMYSIAR